MKKYIIVFFLFIILNVNATSGSINEKSIFECNGKYYGSHGNPLHFHEVIKKDNKWVISGGEVELPTCYIKPINERIEVKFSKCIDGDTAKFIINDKEETVRFLAIDTPEIQHGETVAEPYGNEASDFTCKKLSSAKKIILEFDGNSNKEDKYNRLLAFVFTDNILLQKQLIQNGLAKVYYIYGDYQYLDILKEEEKIAQKNKIGIWDENIKNEEYTPDIIENEYSEEDDTIIKIFNYLKIIWEYLRKIFDLLAD